MSKKTLGIIGKGNLVKLLLNKISSQDKASAAILDNYGNPIVNYDLSDMRDMFSSNYEEIIFYNYGYSDLGNFKKICEVEFRKFGFNVNQLGPKISYCDNDKNKNKGTGLNDFKDFFSSCDVIFDATGPHVPESIFNDIRKFVQGEDYLDGLVNKLANNLIDNNDETNYTNNLLNEFYKSYSDNCNLNGKICIERDVYVRNLKFAIDTMDTLASNFNHGSKNNPRGHRIYELVPFNIPIFLERAELIKNAVMGLSLNKKSLPVYIVAANEPSIMLNIISSVCNDMTDRLVGLTNYDLDRLNESTNELYNGVLSRSDNQGGIKLLGVAGIHDKDFILPMIIPQKGYEQPFQKVFNRTNFGKVIGKLTPLLEGYFFRNQSNRKLVNAAINKNGVQLLVSSISSKDKPLEIYPSMDYNPLNNCYFQEINGRGGKGLFLNGLHRFRNQFVNPEGFLNYLNRNQKSSYFALMDDIEKLNNILIYDKKDPIEKESEDSLVKKHFGISLESPQLSVPDNSNNIGFEGNIYLSQNGTIKIVKR
ncbi:hypothetical protein HN385_03995 [archaeon]|jgi:hypothetical protein|nr:hypothetical protein [archaeon]MBT3450911.1 hypothetical protein [archaeon]MBT6869093.1 hypothetical protein [archaeon]MBT7193336.1 hypothetical protein [archaeon]MBT7380344.1 hypothetical protein [archaeon]